MSDKDMQRAIYASLQSAARPAPRGGPNPLRSFSAIAGTRASSLPVQRPAPLLRGTGSGGGARVNRLAREAIAPAVRGNAGQREAVGAQPLAVVRTSSRRGGAVYASPYSQARVQQQQAATQQGSSNDSNSEEAEARQGQGKPGTVSIASASSTTTAPPGPEPFTGGDPQLVRQIEAEMLERGGETVSFEDIASLDAAKQLLNEAVVLPMAMPEYFVGIREPWRGVLLFGPPGTGKTMLAKAVAAINGLTFFNCSASTLVSKWRGDSEKLIRTVFELASHRAPSIVFVDEVDALTSSRGGADEHEASRRMKSELLSQLDGVATDKTKLVVVLAATNCPWDIDDAFRRRLEKRIFVPLPDVGARQEMFRLYLRHVDVEDDAPGDDALALHLAKATDGYSGADIKMVCRDAALQPMRAAIAGLSIDAIRELKASGKLEGKLSRATFVSSIERIAPSVGAADAEKHKRFAAEFGSV